MNYLVGVGNWQQADDSIGLRIVEHIALHNLDQGFQVIDLSGSGLPILHLFTPETKRILIVDAVLAEKTPGDFFFFTPQGVLSEKELSQFTTHESDILKTIHIGKELCYPIPPLKIMGIQPAELTQRDSLSPLLQKRFELYVATAINALLDPLNWNP